jgi:hypothetical protein
MYLYQASFFRVFAAPAFIEPAYAFEICLNIISWVEYFANPHGFEYRTFKRHIRPSGEKSPAVTSLNGKSELRLSSFLQTNKSINGLGEAR